MPKASVIRKHIFFLNLSASNESFIRAIQLTTWDWFTQWQGPSWRTPKELFPNSPKFSLELNRRINFPHVLIWKDHIIYDTLVWMIVFMFISSGFSVYESCLYEITILAPAGNSAPDFKQDTAYNHLAMKLHLKINSVPGCIIGYSFPTWTEFYRLFTPGFTVYSVSPYPVTA